MNHQKFQPKVLFIYIPYFNYENSIKNSLIKNGYKVEATYLYKYDLIYNLLNFCSKFLLNIYINYKQTKIINKYKDLKFDYVFILQAFQLNIKFLEQLKKNQPEAKFILYNWDSLYRFNYLNLKPYFDKIFSYDPKDCEIDNSIKYLPLFYIEEYNNISLKENKIIDVLFVGSFGSKERYFYLMKFKEFCESNNLIFSSYIYMSLRTYIKLLFKDKYIYRNIKYRTLTSKQICSLFKKSKIIIDMPHPLNNGLTIRTFESLGAGLRLITTNKNIVNEPFYNSNYIYINNLDYSNDLINFIENKTISDKLPFIENYYIENWIKNIF